MSTDNNIRSFTGADIEKYHKGLLSAKERHDLEKAALDDPFLADALEGFAVAGVDHSADMDELKNRLAEKVESGKVIAMNTGDKKSFPWLRVAAMVVIIAGAGLFAQQYLFKGNKKDIAQADTFKKEEVKPVESASTGMISPLVDSTKLNPGSVTVPLKQNQLTFTSTATDSNYDGIISKNANGKAKTTTTEYLNSNNATQPDLAVAPPKVEDEKNNPSKIATGNAEKKDVAREDVKSKTEISLKKDTDADGVNDKFSKQQEEMQNNSAVAANKKFADNQKSGPPSNMFKGRVTDANNIGLPFARVYNPTDNNAGTYTDVSGYFNLTYPDTVLTVQVKSVGFENNNVQLRNTVANNQVIMQDDNSLSEVVISNKKPNVAARSKEANKTLEEPEPADGWDNYDTYLVNNLNAPEEIKTKQNGGGEVQVSFAVDKNGEPTSIKVEKSLCDKCDKEAIRLIKEGPKWKRNAVKKGRTTVTISF